MRNEWFVLFLVSCVLASGCMQSNVETEGDDAAVNAGGLDKLRIGWQTTWATQGQLSQILQKTDILESEGIEGEFVGFAYGGPLNTGALAGSVDVVFTADQPALTLLSKTDDFEIIGRLMYNSGALMVHPESGYEDIGDLEGQKVAVPFVAAVHRVLIGLEKDAGLVPDQDITNVNLGINEIISTAESGKDSGWGDIGAMMVWDPTPFILEEKGLSKTIARGDIVAVVLMSKEKTKDPEVPRRFMRAFKKAYYYYAVNSDQANTWFADSAMIEYDPSILDKASAFEPNVGVEVFDDVRVQLNEGDLDTLKTVSAFMVSQELIEEDIDIDSVVNQEYVVKADEELKSEGFDVSSVKVIA